MAEAARVAVLFDYENVKAHAYECFGDAAAKGTRGEFWPLPLARILGSGARIGDRRPRALTRVDVFQGEPDPTKNADMYWYFTRQCEKWAAQGIHVTTLPMVYLGRQGRQKGVDVEMACAAQDLAHAHEVDVVVMFTADNDLAPAVRRFAPWVSGMPRVELAAWRPVGGLGRRTAMQVDGVLIHWLTGDDYRRAACDLRSDFGWPTAKLLGMLQDGLHETTLADAFREAGIVNHWETYGVLDTGPASDQLVHSAAPAIRQVVLDASGVASAAPSSLCDASRDSDPAAKEEPAATAGPRPGIESESEPPPPAPRRPGFASRLLTWLRRLVRREAGAVAPAAPTVLPREGDQGHEQMAARYDPPGLTAVSLGPRRADQPLSSAQDGAVGGGAAAVVTADNERRLVGSPTEVRPVPR